MERKGPFRPTVTICTLIMALGQLASAEFAGGTGEPNDPYQIATIEQLTSIGADPNLLDKHFVLLNDIDLDPNLPGGRVFDRAVIGKEGLRNTEFSGGFSGGGHIISNLVIVSEQNTPVGLFATLTSRATVEQLGLENTSVSGVETVGTLVGENGGTITACYATGVVWCHTRAKYRPKGSVEETTPEMDEGYAEMMAQLREIYGDRYLNQLGYENQADMPARAGGLVAVNYRCIESCYAAVTVETTSENPDMIDIGGLVGVNGGQIFASYSVGSVAKDAGGLVGNNAVTDYLNYPILNYPITGHVFLSFWDTQASGNPASAAGAGKTTAQMMDVETYQGWDYGEHWMIDDGMDYPRLRWEMRTGAPVPGFGAHMEGTGEPNDPFVIGTADELTKVSRFRSTWDSYLALGGDIDMSAIDPNDFAAIGTLYLPFTGVFDGRGHTIWNFIYQDDTHGRAGLFGLVGHQRLDQIASQGLIQNVNIRQGSVSGRDRVGLLVGESWGTIRACHVDGVVTGTQSWAGGLVGFSAGHIEDCTSSGGVRGGDNVGGLAGASWGKADTIEHCNSSCLVAGQNSVGGLAGYAGGSVRNSYATGHVEGAREVGGFIGDSSARVWACYATGNVSGEEEVGGLIGDSMVSIVACYASGTVAGKNGIGGLVGDNSGGVVACYSTGKVTGEKASGGLIGSQTITLMSEWRIGSDLLCFWDRQTSGMDASDGGIGKTTAQLMQAETFEGWGLKDVWVLDEGQDYPRLAWEGLPGEPIRDDPHRYGGGTGASNDPFQIRTTAHLCAIGTHPGDFDRHFLLMQDIDCAGLDPAAFKPIGVEGFPFIGEFDGQGHAISHLTITRPNEDYVGLFGHAAPIGFGVKSSPTHVIDLHIRNVTVHGKRQVGGLAGTLGKGTVTNCTVTGLTKGDDCVGGLVGWSYGDICRCAADTEVIARHHAGGLVGHNLGTIKESGVTGRITGETRVGGLVGANANYLTDSDSQDDASEASGHVLHSRSDCEVTGHEEIGGLVGYTSQYSRIESCYARGTVKGLQRVGGLIGAFERTAVTNSYAATVVAGEKDAGGFIGSNFDYGRHISQWYVPGFVSSCFWDIGLSAMTIGIGDSPDPEGLVGLPTSQMQKAAVFIDAGWDFEDVWSIREGEDYPRLRWEAVEAEF